MILKILINLLYKVIELIELIEYRKFHINENFNKIVYSKNIDESVLTDDGFFKCDEIHVTKRLTRYKVVLDNDMYLTCGDTHILYKFTPSLGKYEEVYVKDLEVGDYICTQNGNIRVEKIKKLKHRISLYDLSIDSVNRYYTNNILSHNTITTAIFVLHYSQFNNEKNILIGANKGETSTEILDKIKDIYVSLPFFLKRGVVKWNDKTIRFDHNTRIKALTITKTSSIGNAADLIFIDEAAYVPDNIVEPFYKSILPTMASIQNSKFIMSSTPNGMNFFGKMWHRAILPEGHPDKIPFGYLAIFWNQVPGRNMIYVIPKAIALDKYNITFDELYDFLKNKYDANGEFDVNNVPYVTRFKDSTTNITRVNILIREGIVDVDDVRELSYNDIKIVELATVTTWKENEIKVLGSLDAFNQEYDLKFTKSANSVLPDITMERINNSKVEYIPYTHDVYSDRLKWDYVDYLSVINDDSIFTEVNRKNYRVLSTVDVSEGLGLDYSVVNDFIIKLKPMELIEKQYKYYTSIYDLYQIVQFKIFKSNIISPEKLAEYVYVNTFEYHNPDNVRLLIEYNNDGKTLLAELKNVFREDSDYSSHVLMKFNHTIDSTEKKIGLKVHVNKNSFVKDYQDDMINENIIINEEKTILEANSFIKNITPSGNVTYKADSGNDDCIMTVVNSTQGRKENGFRDICEELLDIDMANNSELVKIVNHIKNIDSGAKQYTDYTTFNEVIRRKLGR